MKLKAILLSATAGSVLATAVPAFAQDSAGDIIVTARKRQESILKVPVVETAITRAQLEKFQTNDLNKIAARVPGLVLGTAVLSIGTQVSIRGVGTSSLDAGVDQSVSLNIDGLQLSQGLAYKVGTFDLQQAEVLKGPQALFFGKSSPGGVISLRTADPTDQLEEMARATYGFEAHSKRVEGVLSGPLTDTLGVRAAAEYTHDDGYFRNKAVAAPGLGGQTPYRDTIPTENFIIRGTAVWKPDPKFNARFKINVSRDRIDGNGGDGQYGSCPDGTGRTLILPATAPFPAPPFLSGDENCKLDRTEHYVWMNPANFPGIRNGGQNFTQIWQKFGTLELNYTPADDLTLTSVTGYYDLVYDGLINGVETTSSGPTLSADNHLTRKDYTEELRLNSSYNGPLNFTLGGFYQNSTERNRIAVLGNSALRLPAILTRGTHKLDIESYSAFGQLRYKIMPRLELSGGVRWTHETRSDTVFSIPGAGPPVQRILPTPKITSSNYSPEVTLTWTPTDDLTVFASGKQAYKSGSYSITTIPNPGVDNSFGDEKVQGGEAGIKARALDRHLNVNLAGYYYHYTGLQVGANEPAQGGLPILRTLNAGSANIYGVDFDLNYRPPSIEGLNLRAAVNWNHARFKKLVGVPCVGGQTVAEGCNIGVDPVTGQFIPANGTTVVGLAADLSGGRLVRAPTWQVNFGFDYDMELPNGMKLSFSSDNRYSSRYLTDLLARSDMFQNGYFQTDAAISLAGKNDGWEVSLIGNNLTDKYTTGNCTNFNAEAGQILGGENTGTNTRGPAGVDELTCQANRGREVFVRLTLRPNKLFN